MPRSELRLSIPDRASSVVEDTSDHGLYRSKAEDTEPVLPYTAEFLVCLICSNIATVSATEADDTQEGRILLRWSSE